MKRRNFLKTSTSELEQQQGAILMPGLAGRRRS